MFNEGVSNRGYAEKEGDAREFHPKLRPPVDPEELEIDERTGMKVYRCQSTFDWTTESDSHRPTELHGD